MAITREEIKNVLKEAIEPLERKTDNLSNRFQELKRLVDFVNEKYNDILVQLKQANEKIQRQGTSLKKMQKDLDYATKQAHDAMNGFENLAEYLRRDCLEISGVPPSENYTCNQLVMAVGQAIGVQVKEEGLSTSHPLPTFIKDAPLKIIFKFTRRDTRNSFYTNRRKLIDKKASDLPNLGVTSESKVYISESLNRYKKGLFSEVNKLRKRIRWKHIWTQNDRIYVKESEKSAAVVIDSYEDLGEFKSRHPPRQNHKISNVVNVASAFTSIMLFLTAYLIPKYSIAYYSALS